MVTHGSCFRGPPRHPILYKCVALNGVGTNFGVGVEEVRPEGPRAGDGVLGGGDSQPLPTN